MLHNSMQSQVCLKINVGQTQLGQTQIGQPKIDQTEIELTKLNSPKHISNR